MYFTGKGDKGKTEINSKKIAKDSLIFEVLGELDELNSLIGLSKNYIPKKFFKKLTEIQNDLFIIQTNVAYYLYSSDKYVYSTNKRGFKSVCLLVMHDFIQTKFNLTKLKEERIKELEKEIKEIEKKIKIQESFVIYGSNKESAWFDYLRGLVRRIERRLVNFDKKFKLDDNILSYINRLSSYFYAIARFICYNKKIKERSPWY